MTDKEILTKAIEKAISNGLILIEGKHYFGFIIFSHDFAKAFWGNEDTCMYCGSTKFGDARVGVPGEPIEHEWVCQECGATMLDKAEFDEGNMIRAWQYHLQQMVLEENPISYLGKFL